MEEDIYDDGEETLKRTSKLNGIKADRLLTILAIIFFVVVVAMVCLLIFLQQVAATNQNKCLVSTMERTKVEQKSSAPQHKLTKRLKTIVKRWELWRRYSDHRSSRWRGSSDRCACWYFHCPIQNKVKSVHMSTGSWYANPGDAVKIQGWGVEDNMKQVQIRHWRTGF